MLRREFGKLCVSLGAGLVAKEVAAATSHETQAAATPTPASGAFPDVPGLTAYVADFVVNARYEDIPQQVIELGKKSILDGFGLALAGSRADSAVICGRYLDTLSSTSGVSTVIGTG